MQAIAKKRYIFISGMFIFLLLDGSLSYNFSKWMFTATSSMESRLLLLWLILALCYLDYDKILWWAFVAGIFYDLYYSGILGIFTFLFPLMVYLNRETFNFFSPTFMLVFSIYLIDVTLLTTLSYWINSLIGLANVSATDFIARTLGPTLAYNMFFFVVLYVPLRKLFEKFAWV